MWAAVINDKDRPTMTTSVQGKPAVNGHAPIQPSIAIKDDATSALVNLGYGRKLAADAVERASRQLEASAPLDMVIKAALAHLKPAAGGKPAPTPAKVVVLKPAAPAPTKPAEKPKPKARPAQARPSQRRAREAARIEQQIQTLEEELGGIEARLSEPDAYTDPDALSEDGLRHRSLQEELSHLYREWELRAG
jgi:hypothetical protein